MLFRVKSNQGTKFVALPLFDGDAVNECRGHRVEQVGVIDHQGGIDARTECPGQPLLAQPEQGGRLVVDAVGGQPRGNCSEGDRSRRFGGDDPDRGVSPDRLLDETCLPDTGRSDDDRTGRHTVS